MRWRRPSCLLGETLISFLTELVLLEYGFLRMTESCVVLVIWSSCLVPRVSCADNWSVQLLWGACADSWSVQLLDDPVASHAGKSCADSQSVQLLVVLCADSQSVQLPEPL